MLSLLNYDGSFGIITYLMSITVKVVNAVLTHDTETFSNMVLLFSPRTPTASSKSETRRKRQKPRIRPESDPSGMRPLPSTVQAII
jgi:hypothetical protein